jgi:hypothetical protein
MIDKKINFDFVTVEPKSTKKTELSNYIVHYAILFYIQTIIMVSLCQIMQFLNEAYIPTNLHNELVYELKNIDLKEIFHVVFFV